jgi:hypothetical protein
MTQPADPPAKERPAPRRPMTTPRRAALASEILLTYARVRWLLWRNEHLPTVLAELRGTQVRMSPQDVPPRLAAVRLGRAVTRTLPLLPTDSRCLMRSLVLTSLLARRGVPSRVVIGVQAGTKFAAHAWVEHDGEPVLPASRDVYGRLLEV